MMNTEMKIPALRFPEFKNEWFELRTIQVFTIFNGYAFSSNDAKDSGCRWIKIADVGINFINNESPSYLPEAYLYKYPKFVLKQGDYIVALTRPILNGKLKIARIDKNSDESLLNQRVGKLISSNKLEFLYQLLQKRELISKIDNRIAGSDPPNLSPNEINSIKLKIPSLPEQQKIASFLSSADKRIHLLTQKKEKLEQYKKGIMQQIFSQQLRFKDENGKDYPDWEEKKLYELLSVSKKKNTKNKYSIHDVLSVSGKYGIVNQIEFQGRSFAGASVLLYNVVESGDIVYTKSPLKQNPYGIIKVNKGSAGIVSTLYAVYKCHQDVSGIYLDYYFQIDDHVNSYLRPIVRKGAKNDMKVNNEQVLSGTITLPKYKEQLKIIDFISALDKKIFKVSNQLEKMHSWKKGLLQKMFV